MRRSSDGGRLRSWARLRIALCDSVESIRGILLDVIAYETPLSCLEVKFRAFLCVWWLDSGCESLRSSDAGRLGRRAH